MSGNPLFGLGIAASAVLLFAITPALQAHPDLPPAFDKRIPDTIQDLQAIERHVQQLVTKGLSGD
ncbi:MAG: hypothetical protein EXR98_17690 [Gemmataceae bacterium]|nr:hypothetical protein [Gemmataceae bacterium]